MPYCENSIQIMKAESQKISSGMSNYMLDDVRVNTDTLYPHDPSIKFQNSGLYKNSNSEFMDVLCAKFNVRLIINGIIN